PREAGPRPFLVNVKNRRPRGKKRHPRQQASASGGAQPLKYPSLEAFLDHVKRRDPDQPEFLQAVHEVMSSIWPFVAANPRYAEHGLLDRLVEPERIIQFRISWIDERGEVHVNRGWRVQHSSALGPF